MKWIFIAIIRFYRRFISPALPPTCRFKPTCSEYGLKAYERHGALKGTILTAWRLIRCGPWHPGGYDPVPEKGKWKPEIPGQQEVSEEVGEEAPSKKNAGETREPDH